ncbi:MAG: hypothetical protein MUD11_16665 [Rhodobacteraceae bacterium]|jgi:hypothetical protein|nr:hypothetical protein [Paracoccaceae bacterium]
MTFLPTAISLPLTWGLCLLLTLIGLQQWYASRVAASKLMRVGLTWVSLHPYSVHNRLDHHLGAFYERNGQLVGPIIVIYAAGRALRRAIVAVPLAVITAKAFTEEKVLGLFTVFRDQPEAIERMGRCVLLVLLFAALVWGWDKIAKWSDNSHSKKVKTTPTPPKREKGAPVLPALLVVLYLIGLTPALVLLLTILFSMSAVWSDVAKNTSSDTETSSLFFAAIYLLAMLGFFAIMLTLHLVIAPMGGFVAAVLLLGIILPLACAPAGMIVTAGTDYMIAESIHKGLGSPGSIAVKSILAFCIALVGLVALFIGLWVGLSLYAILAPSDFGLDLALMFPTLWSDPSIIWIAVFLCLTTIFTPVSLLLEALAKEITQRNTAWQRVLALDAKRQRNEETEAAMVRAEIIGCSITGLAIIVPACLLVLALFHA